MARVVLRKTSLKADTYMSKRNDPSMRRKLARRYSSWNFQRAARFARERDANRAVCKHEHTNAWWNGWAWCQDCRRMVSLPK